MENRMSHRRVTHLELACALLLVAPLARAQQLTIMSPSETSHAETLAAREVRRYVYLRTGQLLPMERADAIAADAAGIVVAQQSRPIVRALATDDKLKAALEALKPEQYVLKTVERQGRRVVLIAGGDAVGTLYGAYRFAEHLGVRFYLHGDVVPDERIPLALPVLDEQAAPLFALRGIQPFHDFPEGPDWWNLDDYLAYIGQLPKLRMNFIGLHTYPEGGPNAEPTVWIGLPQDVAPDGRVTFSYPASWHNTVRGEWNWGYAAKKTSAYTFGAAALFDRDDYGADVMRGVCPQPATPADCNELFDRAADMLRAAFTYAHRLGVRTCVGTETPLTIPQAVQARLRSMGKDPADPAVLKELYTGMFTRAARAYPIDYYWLWTAEGWLGGAPQDLVDKTIADMRAAHDAAQAMSAPFRVGTCGWVLGPPADRALFDKALPKGMFVSCINREVGMTPVDRGFAGVQGRDKWAIPWLEDDPALTAPQLWVGRMRRDAADALAYGCNGLMGIHWRTRVLGPNVAALAQAAWDQRGWNPDPGKAATPAYQPGPEGGGAAGGPGTAIEGTKEAPVYQTVRYGMGGYHLPMPNGRYAVTLKFCEWHHGAAGRRVFDVTLQGKPVIEALDVFAKVGPRRALDFTFDDVAVTDGWLHVGFVGKVELPAIAGIVVTGPGYTKKINCGGPAYKDYEADNAPAAAPPVAPSEDFYRDWAGHEFGPEAGPQAAAIFAQVDCKLPRPVGWVDGPGGTGPDGNPWDKAGKEYAFVDDLAALRPNVKGAGNLERFDYWLNTFQYMRAIQRMRCVWAEFDKAVNEAKAQPDAAARAKLGCENALPAYQRLTQAVGELHQHLFATVSTPGEMGTIENWQQHNRVLPAAGQALAEVLGGSLPPEAQPPTEYKGPTRVIVPTVRTSLEGGQALTLKVIVLAEKPPTDAALYWRPLGTGAYAKLPLAHVARGVYTVQFPPGGVQDADLEYYVEVVADAGPVRFPATAPSMGQTVVVVPPER
jgi:hypothetical protein